MTIIVEISRQFVKPFRFKSEVMTRFGFGWIAIGFLRVPFREFCETSYKWSK